MLRSIKLENWKSFEQASLPIDQLTVLIGTNASGKSNALDALEFLSRTASATDILSAIMGDSNNKKIRGGLEWVSHRGSGAFVLTVTTSGEDDRTDYEYSISVETNSSAAELLSEQLVRIRYQGKTPRRLRLFWTDDPEDGAPGITARLYNTKAGTKQPVRRNLSVLSQLLIHDLRSEIEIGIRQVLGSLQNVFILDPNPSSMREYSRPAERLNRDGSNVAGVLAALPDHVKKDVESKLSGYAMKIPEKDIINVWGRDC